MISKKYHIYPNVQAPYKLHKEHRLNQWYMVSSISCLANQFSMLLLHHLFIWLYYYYDKNMFVCTCWLPKDFLWANISILLLRMVIVKY